MIRQANKQDISRIAESIVFGKRVAYRPIFENDEGIVKGVIYGRIIDDKTIEIMDFYVKLFLWDRE